MGVASLYNCPTKLHPPTNRDCQLLRNGSSEGWMGPIKWILLWKKWTPSIWIHLINYWWTIKYCWPSDLWKRSHQIRSSHSLEHDIYLFFRFGFCGGPCLLNVYGTALTECLGASINSTSILWSNTCIKRSVHSNSPEGSFLFPLNFFYFLYLYFIFYHFCIGIIFWTLCFETMSIFDLCII